MQAGIRLGRTFFKEKSHEQPFADFTKAHNISGIEGHRSVGGFRASLYNALPLESVQYLVDAMKEFELKFS